MVHGKIDTEGLEFELVMEDILHLNRRAMAAELDVVKVSYNTYGHIRSNYELLHSGSAMGKGCGPLLIARSPLSREKVRSGDLKIAIPGKNTTANLLLSYFAPDQHNREEMLFHEVMPAVVQGECDAGVIIHENRFTYQDLGLCCVQDLGAFWEEQTQLPIPLGGICAKRSLGNEKVQTINRVLKRSVEYAFAHPEASQEFVKFHAQEMDPQVSLAHINLYVNEFSRDLGAEGLKAVDKLLEVGTSMGLYKE
ncbi:UNVERIFIED_CONTAM: hypothetical protein GTU68_029095 [Idotea baltica]|nr:hypothetical protein [Idotea baltica]